MFAGWSLRSFAALVVALAALAALPALPAAAADCPTAGGVKVPSAAKASGDFVITAKGWGHGVGMSQYGAQGAARLGCSATDILTAYYPGVTVGTADTAAGNGQVRVGLTFRSILDNTVRTLKVHAAVGRLRWRVCDPRCDRVATQRQGATWRLRTLRNGSFALFEGKTLRWTGGDLDARIRVRLSSRKHTREALLPAKQRQQYLGGRYRWGSLQVDSARLGARARSYVTLAVPSVEHYLRGLSEMPSSWESAALAAQAIVGRSFVVDRRDNAPRGAACGGCHLYDSVADQNYTGFGKEAEGSNAVYGRRWTAAVASSAGRVLRHKGSLAVGYYSSSHGGHSESGAFTWGTNTGYLKAVDDSRWEMASSNPVRSSAVGLSAEQLGMIFGVGKATAVRLPTPQGAAGRVGRIEAGYGGVVVRGTQRTVRVSGAVFRTKVNTYLGREAVRSTLFTVTAN